MQLVTDQKLEAFSFCVLSALLASCITVNNSFSEKQSLVANDNAEIGTKLMEVFKDVVTDHKEMIQFAVA